MFSFTNWIFKLFPDFFKQTDSYKDVNDRGIWERYVTNFGIELDNNFYTYISTIQNLFNGLTINPEYLPYAALNAGGVTLTGTNSIDARMVAWACSLWKVKGTIIGFQMVFNLLGFPDIEILEHFPADPGAYDDGITIYDGPSGLIPWIGPLFDYDGICAPCVEYDIIYNNNGIITSFTESQWAIIQSLICEIQPIDTKINSLIPAFPAIDTLDSSSWVEAIHINATTCSTVTGLTMGYVVDFDFNDDFSHDFLIS